MPISDQTLQFLMECHPAILVLGAALLTVASVLSGTAVLTLTGRRHKAGAIIGHVLSLTLAFLAFCVSDWALMEMLSYLRVSFSTDPRWSLFFSTLVRTLLLWGLLLLVVLTILLHQDRPAQGSPRKSKSLSPFTVFLAANLAISALEAYAYIIEPLAVETTHLTLAFDDLDAQAPPVRIVHLTDIHVERFGPRETAIIRQVNALKPDLILLTGDYLNLSYLTDPTAIAHFRELLAQLQAPHGAYAVRGSLESEPEYMARLVEGTGVRWLEQEAVTVEVRGQRVTLVGVACSHKQWRDTARLAEAMKGLPADAFTILLYHSPDLIHEVAAYEVDLYLAGHTHGGQIRLPLYGAIITGSAYGQRYASGLFREGSTTMYVSRGIGLEGGAAPRVRFLSRPEVVSIDLVGK